MNSVMRGKTRELVCGSDLVHSQDGFLSQQVVIREEVPDRRDKLMRTTNILVSHNLPHGFRPIKCDE